MFEVKKNNNNKINKKQVSTFLKNIYNLRLIKLAKNNHVI